jgi:FkbM family methyltransferase
MGHLITLTRRLHQLAGYVEAPRLWRLRQRGVDMAMYRSLDLPWLKALRIATILDIGSNVGHFAAAAHEVMPDAQIYAFEPLPDLFAELESRLSRITGAKAFNFALGDCSENITFERNLAHASSSFLKIGATHVAEFPFTADTASIRVRVERLDDVTEELVIREPLLVKIDVQGFEDRVLRGGERTIRRARVVVIETSFEVLYESQVLFADVHRVLEQWGFQYKGSLEQMTSPKDGRILQADSIFVRQPQ